MSIRERLEDALILWNAGRKQGAWIQVLIAAAATSRIRFPKPQFTDKQAFTMFIRQVTMTIVEGKSAVASIILCFFRDVPGDGVDFDQLMYAHLRCNLVHEAIMADEVQLSESRIIDNKLVADLKGSGTRSDPLKIPDFWVLHLAKAVAEAPENAADCAAILKTLGG